MASFSKCDYHDSTSICHYRAYPIYTEEMDCGENHMMIVPQRQPTDRLWDHSQKFGKMEKYNQKLPLQFSLDSHDVFKYFRLFFFPQHFAFSCSSFIYMWNLPKRYCGKHNLFLLLYRQCYPGTWGQGPPDLNFDISELE